MTQKGPDIIRVVGNAPPELFAEMEMLEKEAIPGGWSAESFRSEAQKENGYVLCARDGDTLCAFLTGYAAAGEGDITNVVTSPEFRRKGLATRLIGEFERLLPSSTENIFLEVRESNGVAIGLYEKCGFIAISTRKNFYTDPSENAIVMKKEIRKNAYPGN